MNINDIQLTPQIVADLYRSSLIESGEGTMITALPEKKEETIPGPGWKSIGNNQKNILVIVQYAEAVHLPDKELGFLASMLGACKLGLDDVAIVNIHGHSDLSYKELLTFFKSRIVFLFDVEPASFGLPMSFPHYQLQAFANATFLYSPSLSELESDKLQKSKLWVCLKRLFNL